MDTKLIFGPPGTGKTTKLLSILEEELKTYETNEIAFVSYTREGVNQGKKRAKEKFGGKEDDYPYFRTLHSLAFYSLGAKRNEMIQRSHYRKFSDSLGMWFTGYYTEDLKHNDDKYLFVQDLHRNNAKATKFIIDNMDIHKYRFVKNNYKRYKEWAKVRDFTDLIEEFVERGESVPVKVAIVDEAQDLSTLQWKMIWTAFKDVDKIYIAGDDDQAIYQWAGADVDYFLDIDGDIEILDKSYRLPESVLEISKSVTKQISRRVNKKYSSTGKQGDVLFLNNLKGLNVTDEESWMFLSRNNVFLKNVKEYLEDKGIPYRYKGSPTIKEDDLKMIKLYDKCSKNMSMTDVEEHNLKKVLKDGYNLRLPWFANFKWDSSKILHVKEFLNRGYKLDSFKVEVNTIHSTKGSEADNVVLLLDVTKQVHDNINSNPDSEHRVFYVGMTRARKRLFLVNSTTKYKYKIYR